MGKTSRLIGLTAIAVLAAAPCVRAALTVPPHSSLTGAPANLYLNFLGDFTPSFSSFSNITTPVYDTDGDQTNFSSRELDNIDRIWSAIAEKYSPFDLNVTTVDPGNRDPGKTFTVDIGGDGAWLGQVAGGVSAVGGFIGGDNTAFVFPANLGPQSVNHYKYVGEAASHEAGHGFGLWHQSTYDPNTGGKIEEYSTNNNSTIIAPVMGVSYYAQRGLWWKGTSSVSRFITQDDLAKISATGSGTNNFGYRADDHPNTVADAEPLSIASGFAIKAQGIIEHIDDLDMFKFTTPGGDASIFADVNRDSPMLDLSLSLLDHDGNVIATAATSSLGEYLKLNLAPDTYEIQISSAAINYGDLGQYFISGFVAPEPTALAGLLCGCMMLVRRRGR